MEGGRRLFCCAKQAVIVAENIMIGWLSAEDINHLYPINGWVLVKVIPIESPKGLVVLPESLPMFRLATVIRESSLLLLKGGKSTGKRESQVHEGDIVLFPSAYTESMIGDVYDHHVYGDYYLIKSDSILLCAEDIDAFSDLDLWAS